MIVVGGGPGGSTAAWRLAKRGLRPLVLDAAVFPRVKICAGWVTHEALCDLDIDPDRYPLTIQPFDLCVLEFEGARHHTAWRRPASYGIIRREFDHYLLERAAAAGADVRWGNRVTGVEQGRHVVAVQTEHGRFEAPLVIGAGGHRCPVARALGDISEREEVVAAQESETRLPAEWVERLAPFMRAPELYVEVTVMKQSLVTRKNRKLRKLRARYPEIKIKLFYKRDIERLAQRYHLNLAS